MKRQRCRGRGFGRPLAPSPWLVLVSFFTLTRISFSQTSDFLIVQNTQRLVVYDAFQQFLGSGQNTPIRPYAPLKILARKDVLGDGVTPCMKIEADGEVFYLLRDETGKLSGWRDLGIVKTFFQRKAFGDTISVLASGRIALEKPAKGGRALLPAGVRCVRYFDDGGATYIVRLGPQPAFGWAVLPLRDRGKSWQIVRPEKQDIALSPMVRDRVISRIQQVNQTYAQVYGLLVSETGKRFAVPRWSVDSSGAMLTCVLTPAAAARFYPESITQLITSIQAYVVGTGYVVTSADNRIQIGQR